MPNILRERFPYVILMVLWEVGVFMVIADGGFNVSEPDEETKKGLRAEAEALFKKYHKDNK